MNTCDTCKWWGSGLYSHNGPDGYQTCDHERMVGGHRVDGMEVVNVELFSSGCIATGPKFGCVHHQPIAPAPGECPES